MAKYTAAIDEDTRKRIQALPGRVHFPAFMQKAITAFIGELEKNPDLRPEDFIITHTARVTERKQIEEALLKSNALNQSIIDSSTDCIKLLDLEGRLQYMSPGGRRLLGIQDMGKFLNVSYPEFWKGADHQAALEAIQQAQQGHPATFQGYCPTIDGTPKWWDVAISPILGTDGKPERLLAVSRDITERRQAEEALQASSDRYRSYIEVTGQLGWTANPDGEVVEDLPSWRIYTGQTYEEVKGRGWSKTLHPEDFETALQIWEKAVTEKGSCEVECRIRRHDGVYRHFMVRGIPVLREDGSLREWVGTCIDITERKQEEELLRDTLAASQQRQSEISALKDKLEIRVQERTADLLQINQALQAEIAERTRAEEAVKIERQRLYAVLETLPVYVVLLSRDYHMPFANRFFRERFGESCGRRCFEYLFGRSEPCEICETYTALKTMAPHHWEWTGPDKRNYDIFDFPFTDSDGSTLILEMGIDITAQKQAEKEIIKINQELEQRVTARTAELEAVNRELEAFSYTVSHDLKTPLRSIQGFAQAIAEDYSDKLDDAGRDYLRRLTSAGKRMTQLIDAMLSISRLTRRELMGKAVNLSSFAEVIAYELKKNEPGRAAEFIIAKGVKAHGDSDMLEIALRNLFDNAWKFTGKHASARIEFGAIECGVRNAECGTIPNSETGKTVYFVSDNGSGFSMQFADKLFQPFRRLHSESEFPGLGIGLATVSKIINKHGGKIWAEAEPEKGATFYFTLG
ncbi:MAG: PAS domain S-box protein [Nitrospiraceae bacterium]|nr:MAG: PAS domain S-box protein [Nitrospiraceae bacterium]